MFREMNRCWTAGLLEEQFRRYLHPDAIAILPTTPGRIEGQDSAVAGWRDFAETAIIQNWKKTDLNMQLYDVGKCAG